MGYTKDVIKGVSWMSSFRMLTRLVSFFKIAIIARILTPGQFGIFGIASLVLSLLEMLTETGINVIIIQSKEKLEDYIDSVWVVSIVRGLIISLFVIVSSPLISSFFKSPDSQKILLLISLVPLIRGFINPASAKLQKELQFKYEFIFRSVVFIFDAFITILFTLITHSVYSLVLGLLAGAILEVLISFIFIKPLPKFAYNHNYLNKIFHKGKWITALGIFNYFAQEGDNIVLGRVMGTSFLGIYQMAYKISILPISEIGDVVSRVVFPVYSKIENDRKRLKKAFFKSMMFVFLPAVIMGLIIFLFPKQIIIILLGEKWISAEQVLRVLALYGVLRVISGFASTIFFAMGKQNYVTGMTFARFITLAITIYPFVKIFGMIGAGYSALLSVFVEIPVVMYYILVVFNFRSKSVNYKTYENSNIS